MTGSQVVGLPDGTRQRIPTYSVYNTLSPGQQILHDQNEQLGQQENNIAGQALTNVAGQLANPTTMSSFAPIQMSANLDTNTPTSFANTQNQILGSLGNTDFTADRDSSTNAILQRLAPSMAAQDESRRAMLANQGVTQGSDAYGASSLQQAQQNNDLRLGAITAGDQEQQALFGERLNAGNFQNAAQQQEYGQLLGRAGFAQDATGQNNQAKLAGAGFYNQAQQQQYTEGMGINNNLINQISALRSGGQVPTPQFAGYQAGNIDQTPVASSIYNSAALNEQACQTQAQMAAANNSAFGQILGAGLGMFRFGSDRRLKRNIELIGTGPNGFNLYLYQYRERPGYWIGFMADEVERVRPDAVSYNNDGFAVVDYQRAVASEPERIAA